MAFEKFIESADRLYTAFLMRDLNYLAAGLMITSSASYDFQTRTVEVFDHAGIPIWVVLIGAYYIGCLAQAAGVAVRIMTVDYGTDYAGEDQLRWRCHPSTVMDIERAIFGMLLGASMGAAAGSKLWDSQGKSVRKDETKVGGPSQSDAPDNPEPR